MTNARGPWVAQLGIGPLRSIQAFLDAWRGILLGTLVFSSACQTSATSEPAGNTSTGGLPDQTIDLACVLPIFAKSCAVSGCHDPVTRDHGMDLSTSESVYTALVGRNGLDVCGNQLSQRVVPGDPDGSLLIQKVSGLVACSRAQRMPPPPAPPMVQEDIETLRTWIASGAPRQCDPPVTTRGASASASAGGANGTALASTGGAEGVATVTGAEAASTGVASAGSSTAATTAANGGATSFSSNAAATTSPDNPFACTADYPCEDGLLCGGTSCSNEWECVAHSPDPTQSHPCSENIVPFCGCDGVTFESPEDCPDRPWHHIGACDDGYSCDPWRVDCDQESPPCPSGELPSVADGCWGECVQPTSCRCLYHWECGDDPTFTCDREAFSCAPATLGEE